MNKNKQNTKLYKLYAVILLIASIVTLAKLNAVEYIHDILILVILYIVSLPASYVLQIEDNPVSVDKKAVYGFAVGISLASLMAFFWLNLAIYGL